MHFKIFYICIRGALNETVYFSCRNLIILYHSYRELIDIRIVLTCRFQLSVKIIWFDLCTKLILRPFEICNIYITLPCLKLLKDLPFSCASLPGFCGMWYERL